MENNESEEQAAERTRRIHNQVERNLYLFLGAMLLSIAGVSVYVIAYNRRIFDAWPTSPSGAASWRNS